ncbi:unnamed protein product, partial [Mesorhabditis belari]|uniref:Fork-head domain-containing protein n=1 Tax=Mesorhabditis belari TaxID=2138241 RepID=A0AAF3FFJ4_9BILA
MISDARPPDPQFGDQLLLLALQERLMTQQRAPSPPQSQSQLPAALASSLSNSLANSLSLNFGTNLNGLTAQLNGAGLGQLNGGLSNNMDATTRLYQQMILGLGGLPFLGNPLDLASCLPGTSSSSHPLWNHNMCGWPGCEQPCESINTFYNHLAQAHPLDERSAHQLRQQIETVDGLEHRLSKERTRLQAMMQHLHMKTTTETPTTPATKTEPLSPMRSPKQEMFPIQQMSPNQTSVPTTVQELLAQVQPSVSSASVFQSTFTMSDDIKASTTVPSTTTTTTSSSSRRSRISDKTAQSTLPIATDIARNREFYRTNDVRPPYTYASLIRQAIMESPECQLTLNEIYQWFQETFAYFRRNAATWKNAVRHNLSLHKCFTRVEQNVKGAVWTVDDSEFYRRRPQRASVTRSQPQTPALSIADSLLTQRFLDQTALQLRGADGSLMTDGDITNNVLSFLNGENPLSLLSAAAAAHSIDGDGTRSEGRAEIDLEENFGEGVGGRHSGSDGTPEENTLIIEEQH